MNDKYEEMKEEAEERYRKAIEEKFGGVKGYLEVMEPIAKRFWENLETYAEKVPKAPKKGRHLARIHWSRYEPIKIHFPGKKTLEIPINDRDALFLTKKMMEKRGWEYRITGNPVAGWDKREEELEKLYEKLKEKEEDEGLG